MCELNKHNAGRRMDPCMKNLIDFLHLHGVETLACCCGHGKYPMSIVCRWGGNIIEIISYTELTGKKRFYKKDKQGYYYIPEVIENEKKN